MASLTRALIEARLPCSAETGTPPAGVPEAELRRGMQDVLDQRREPDGIWVFAYGSLMWEGGFAHDAVRVGTVKGLVRRYCIWDNRNRGTPERRALTLGLEREPGTCAGLAFHLAEEDVQEALWTVWKQEMTGGYYTAEWVEVAASHGPVAALTFIADPRHPLYAGALRENEVTDVLAAGVGPGGTAAAYLLQTAEAMRDRGIPDPYLERFEAEVARRLSPS